MIINKNNVERRESLSNFSKKVSGYGHFKVSYRSPKTGKIWSRTIESNSNLFHDVFEVENPSLKALNNLKKFVKQNNL